jgi:hypothetical protein
MFTINFFTGGAGAIYKQFILRVIGLSLMYLLCNNFTRIK